VTRADRTLARRTAVVLGVVLLVFAALLLIYAIRRVLVWILIAAFFAVALHPAVNWVEGRARWLPRWLAALVVFAIVIAVLIGLSTLFVLPLIHEGTRLADQFPTLVSDARAGRGPIGGLLERLHLRQYLSQHADQIRSYASNLTRPTLGLVRGAASTAIGALAVAVVSFLMVLQAPRLVAAFLGLFDDRRAERIRRVGRDCARTITGYLTGNLLISVICGGLTYVVLLVMGVPFAGLIALFVGLVDLIPLVGATLGAVAATIPALLHSVTAGIVVLAFFVIYQQLENHLLQPVIYARTVRLNALTVLIAILAAAELAGILGALLAIPVAGMVQVIIRDILAERRSRRAAGPASG
jgi:predicted PurR-regulated permease PerM